MESVVALLAEWISLGEMIKLQDKSISDILKECQDKEAMDLLGDQVWKETAEEWAEYVYGEGNSPALWMEMSGLAVKQTWLAWMKTCKGLR